MFDQNFDPYQIILELQRQVAQLYANQDKLMAALNHQADALKSMNHSNQRHFDLTLEHGRKINDLALDVDRQKKAS